MRRRPPELYGCMAHCMGRGWYCTLDRHSAVHHSVGWLAESCKHAAATNAHNAIISSWTVAAVWGPMRRNALCHRGDTALSTISHRGRKFHTVRGR